MELLTVLESKGLMGNFIVRTPYFIVIHEDVYLMKRLNIWFE